MRIISGTHKGRPIKVTKDFKDRPTTDFAKESLFNILKNMFNFENLKVLDLFAGSGNISFEFASNGIFDITMVDNNPQYIDFIEQQAAELFPENKFIYIPADVFDFLKKYSLNYDIIFADPPYKLENISSFPDLILENNTILNDTLFILEHSKLFDFEDHKYFLKHKKYGKVHFSFFIKINEQIN